MNLAAYYSIIYLSLVALMTIVTYVQYQGRQGFSEFKHTNTDVLASLLVLSLILFIGMRPVSYRYFGDMGNYVMYYNTSTDYGDCFQD